MPNKNYVAGRAFEYRRKRHYEALGWKVLRTAGSHGAFDLICYDTDTDDGKPIQPMFVQCKKADSEAEANRLIAQFTKSFSYHPHQTYKIDVKVGRTILSEVVI